MYIRMIWNGKHTMERSKKQEARSRLPPSPEERMNASIVFTISGIAAICQQ